MWFVCNIHSVYADQPPTIFYAMKIYPDEMGCESHINTPIVTTPELNYIYNPAHSKLMNTDNLSSNTKTADIKKIANLGSS